MKKKSISIFGVTGSVGSSTLDLLRQRKDEFEVIAMTCNNNIDLLLELSKEFNPKAIAVADDNFYLELKKRADGSVECFGGSEGLMEISNFNSDIVIASIVGLAGLESMLSSIKNTSVIAVANKECIVAAGSLVMSQAKKYNCQIIPIDSEHNAIFQILDGKSNQDVEKIYLTASGGPFYKFSHSQLKNVTPAQAVKHPVWSMGKKISVDSATLMNKGLEIIEAHHLFGLENKRIEVILHRQSIIHGLALMKNGALLGYFGKPSMLNPIDHALSWPLCEGNNIDPITIEDLNNLQEMSNSVETYDFVNLIKKYDLKDYIISIIYKNKKEVKILSKINLNNSLKINNQKYSNINLTNQKDLNMILENLQKFYEDEWKKNNEINTSIKLPLTISINSSNYEVIKRLEETLDNIDLISDFYISKFNNNHIQYKIIYNSSPKIFLNDMISRNFDLKIENNIWKIK